MLSVIPCVGRKDDPAWMILVLLNADRAERDRDQTLEAAKWQGRRRIKLARPSIAEEMREYGLRELGLLVRSQAFELGKQRRCCGRAIKRKDRTEIEGGRLDVGRAMKASKRGFDEIGTIVLT